MALPTTTPTSVPVPKDSPPSYAEAMATTSTGTTRRGTAASARPGGGAGPMFLSFYAYLDGDDDSAEPLFPTAFGVYYQQNPPGTPRGYFVGESRVRPLYNISTSLSSPTDLTLHSSLSPDTPALATITYGGPSRRIANITISPPANAFSSTLARSETLSLGGSRSHRRSFSITTTASAGRRQRVEAFEWRHSYGPEVESLGGSRDDGWKLVRMSSSDARGAVRHTFPSLYLAKRYPSKVGTSSDGKEVVAVWCAAGLGRSFSSKCMRFRFLGSGADGSLGQRWAVMAVASALAMWHND